MSTGLRRAGAPSDGGAATVWVLLATACVVAVTALVLVLAAAMTERARAQAVADLAAVAASGHRPGAGGPAGCAAASAVAARAGWKLGSCRLEGQGALVRVVAVAPTGSVRWPAAVGTAESVSPRGGDREPAGAAGR